MSTNRIEDTWDATVDELVRIVAALVRLHAGATGERAIAANLQQAAAYAARAAALALPLSSYERADRRRARP